MKKMTSFPPRVTHQAAVLLAIALSAPLASAQTALEDKVFKAPMAHTQITGGTPLKAHYVRLVTAGQDTKMADMSAKMLQEGLRACLAEKTATGAKANPPKVLPKLSNGVVTDTYYAPNRQVTYRRHYQAGLNATDCSLDEYETHEAVVESSIGSCKLDMMTGQSEGQCNMAAHAKAPVTPAPAREDNLEAQMAKMAADPRTAVAAAQMRKLVGNKGGGPTGEKKTLLGIECDVVQGMGMARVCRARGGSFKPATFAGANPGIILEDRLEGVSESKAVQAKLDADISAAVFAPQARAGAGKQGGAK